MRARGFFDAIDHALLMKAVRYHVSDVSILLYVERWLNATTQFPDRRLERHDSGVPQGGVISPLLSNLFLHYACDRWLQNFRDARTDRGRDNRSHRGSDPGGVAETGC